MRETPCNVVIRVAGGGGSRIPLVGNGGARPPASACMGEIMTLIAGRELTIDASNVAIIVTRRAGRQGCVLVVECFSSRAILLKPLSATLVRNGSGGKESTSECGDGDELEVEGRHLSKMLRGLKNWKKEHCHFILEPYAKAVHLSDSCMMVLMRICHEKRSLLII